MEARDRQRQCSIEVIAETAEIGRQHDLQLRQRARELFVCRAQRLAGRIVEIENETGFVELHPCGALRSKPLEQIDIDRQQAGEQRQRIEFTSLLLPSFR